MFRVILSATLFTSLPALAVAASLTNADPDPVTLVVTEAGVRNELVLEPGETISACDGGCFLTLPNGDRETLAGGETVEIKGGAASIR